MLCELAESQGLSFVSLWLALNVLALASIVPASGVVFYAQYVCHNYAQWRHKTLPHYPSASDVRGEVLAMLKGMAAATVPPSLSIYLSQRGLSYGYCGVEPHGWFYLAATFLLAFVASDCYEWAYHRLGHTSAFGWRIHKHHHVFHNPSPFAVIADEPLDQFARALPLLIIPVLIPINMDMLFATYSIVFYYYGVYLHCGHELDYPDAHHPILNTSFQHCMHHAVSVRNLPYHTGFFFKIWDDLLGAVHPPSSTPGPKCRCVKCARSRGERSLEAYKKLRKPEYAPLLSVKFWMTGEETQDTHKQTESTIPVR